MLILFSLGFLSCMLLFVLYIWYVSFSWFVNIILFSFSKFVCYYLYYIYATLVLVSMLILFGLVIQVRGEKLCSLPVPPSWYVIF